jgi:phosphoglycerate dehydrogenase-like enzyme
VENGPAGEGRIVMPAARVVVTARAFFSAGRRAAEPLAAAGLEVVRAPRFGPLGEDELIAALRGAAAVIASSDPYTERVLDACPELRVIARTGVGYDSIDLEAATRRGVVALTTPGRIAETVADFTFAVMLAMARRIPEAVDVMRRGGWAAELPGTDLWGKCLGVVGMGAVGTAVAKRARGFAMRVLGFDPGLDPQEIASRGAEPVDLERLLAEADFVTLHAALTPQSRRLIGPEALERMKPTAYLVNTARGALVDTDALLEALDAGRLAGAALDAFELEPLPAEHPLRHAPRSLLTPHIAFSTRENSLDMSRRAAAAVAAILRGEPPPADVRVLNPEALRR